jgi:hypothetical protein
VGSLRSSAIPKANTAKGKGSMKAKSASMKSKPGSSEALKSTKCSASKKRKSDSPLSNVTKYVLILSRAHQYRRAKIDNRPKATTHAEAM